MTLAAGKKAGVGWWWQGARAHLQVMALRVRKFRWESGPRPAIAKLTVQMRVGKGRMGCLCWTTYVRITSVQMA